jgi:hypothetical protein
VFLGGSLGLGAPHDRGLQLLGFPGWACQGAPNPSIVSKELGLLLSPFPLLLQGACSKGVLGGTRFAMLGAAEDFEVDTFVSRQKGT